ncbi:MAG: ATP-binding cassette domain-containing protein [Legionellales bacterium]|nr:ATP-binding cassette domain-containing protein [Legionellales bacterium]
MLSLKNIHLQRGTKTLFDNLDLTIHVGQKMGLIGENGSGKSTLFNLMLREVKEDAGTFYMPANWHIGHLAQETPSLPIPAIDYVLQGDAARESLLQQLTIAEETHDGMQIAELHGQLHDIDGYTAPARAAQLLDGLGFPADTINNPVASFSGGWRVRLNLARILMSRADILMLDEPTNHLDLEAIVWLENWLKQYRGSLLIISHDRDFLDNTIDSIAHLYNKQIKLYSGNYSAFERQRAEQLIIQQKTVEKMQQKRDHLQQFIDRFKAKATKAKQAQSRVKALEKLPMIQAAHMDSPFSFTIPNPIKQPNPLMQLHHAIIGYTDKPILKQVDFSLAPGVRIGLLGLNGAGKSTLIKTLAGDMPLLGGERMIHPDTKIGYFAQHQLDYLELSESAMWHLKKISPLVREQELRDYLGSFNFRGDQALVPIEPFSGGEKSRLALALLVWQRPNLLLLDEPTNHLDREMREALTESLQFYEGAMVIVSHDRHLLRASCDDYFLVENGSVREFSNDLDDYLIWRQQQRNLPQTKTTVAPVKIELSAEEKKVSQNRLKSIESRLDKLQAELAIVEKELTNGALYEPQQANELQKLQQKLKKINDEINALEAEWFKLSEKVNT